MALTEEEAAKLPEAQLTSLLGMPGYKFAIVVSSLDCTGCGSCANVCPGKKGEKALNMTCLEEGMAQPNEQEAFNVAVKFRSQGRRCEVQRDHCQGLPVQAAPA